MTEKQKVAFYNAFTEIAGLALTWGVAAIVVGFYVWAHFQ